MIRLYIFITSWNDMYIIENSKSVCLALYNLKINFDKRNSIFYNKTRPQNTLIFWVQKNLL